MLVSVTLPAIFCDVTYVAAWKEDKNNVTKNVIWSINNKSALGDEK